ncbi:glycosyltransferase [Pseudomonas stutzeri]|uniref:Glycosyltransferase n=1 Tax=Stutzerimonas stutzeri TaxID=316 RepID=A0A2N8RXV7_STUST|nr:glycosyltransferase [Stutzerimonas stutzeri]MCQ4296210.1 glycosyltransferase [Stutzerimonas stutzeri]PNF79204.1 hypothetical protein CXK92_16925 [Stutzerimonas stutzeri]
MRGLKYISWGDTTGYAVAAKAYVRALVDAGVVLTWTPMMPGAAQYEAVTSSVWPCAKLASVCNKSIEYDRVLIHTVPEYYPPIIERERGKNRLIFGYTVWELERLPEHWPAILNRLDGVIVPCRWNVEVFRRSGVTVPIHVVAHLSQFDDIPLAGEAAHAALRARFPRSLNLDGRQVFYNIGFWSHRKAPYLALEAYWQAFDVDDPVLMILKTSRQDITRWHRHWRNGFRLSHPSPATTVAEMARRFPRAATVALIEDESLDDAQMLALHELGDCFISLARAEGWGLGAFEAARLGKPVVMTAYGGQQDFLNPAFSYPVDYTLVPVHEPTWAASYKPSDQWAEPLVAQAAAHLRTIHADPQSAQTRARHQAERIAHDFSKGAVTDALVEVLA